MGKKGVALPSAQSIETDPPVDFLVKNMVECDSDLLRDQLLSDLQYASLCEMETSVPLLLKKDLMTSWILFYQAHGRLFDLIVWLVRKELTEGKAYPQVSSPLLCHLTKMLLSVEENENAASLLPSFEATTGLKDRAQERLFDPLILLAIEKEKEGSIFSTHSLLQFLLEEKENGDPKGIWQTKNFPPLLKFLVKFMKKERDRSVNFLSLADQSNANSGSSPQISRHSHSSPAFPNRVNTAPLPKGSSPLPPSPSPSFSFSTPPPDLLYPDSVYSLVIGHFLCAILKENQPKAESRSTGSARFSRNTSNIAMEILTKKDDSEAVEGSSHFLVMLTMGMKEAAMEYVKSGQPNGPFPDSGDGKRDVLLRFGYALRCLWDDLRKDVNGSIVEKKARTAGSVESQTEALMNLKTNLALCQDCLDEDLPGSSDLYARHFTDALRYMAVSEEGWELIKVKKKQKDSPIHDLSVWMKLPEGSPFHLFKASKIYPVSVPTMFNFLRDIQNNFKTDKTLTTAEVVHTYTASRKLVYIRNHFSWPMDDRDCLMATHEMISPDFQEAAIAGHSVELPSFPTTKGVDRVFLLISGYFIEAAEINQVGEKGKGKAGSRKKEARPPRKKAGCKVSYLIQCKTDSKLIPSGLFISIMKNTMRTKLNLEEHLSGEEISPVEAKNLPVRLRDAGSKGKRMSEIAENRHILPSGTSPRFFDKPKKPLTSPKKQLTRTFSKKRSKDGEGAPEKAQSERQPSPQQKREKMEGLGEGPTAGVKAMSPILQRSLSLKTSTDTIPNNDNANVATDINVPATTSANENTENCANNDVEIVLPQTNFIPAPVSSDTVAAEDLPSFPLEELLCLMVSDIEVADRYHKRKMFSKTFLGRDFVAWLMDHEIVETEIAGVQMGNDMIQLGMLWPAQSNVDRMQNDDSFYRFACHAIDLAGEEGLMEGDTESLIPQLGKRVDVTSKQCSALSEEVRALKMEMGYIRHSLEQLEGTTKLLASRPPPSLAPVPSHVPPQVQIPVHPQKTISDSHVVLCCLLAALSNLGWMVLPQFVLIVFQIGILVVIGLVLYLGHQKEKEDRTRPSLLVSSRSMVPTSSTPSSSSPSSSLSFSDPMSCGSQGEGELLGVPADLSEVEPTVEGLRGVVSKFYPEISDFEDSYIQSVMDVKGRSFEQSIEKFRKVLEWRNSQNVDGIVVAAGEGVMAQLCEEALYMYGYDRNGHPLFWVRPHLKDYKKMDVEKEIIVHILLLELGIKSLPKGMTTFVLVAETGKLGMRDFSPALMKGLINLLTSGYPDRLEGLYAGPINFVVRMMYKVLSPIVPARLLSKVHLMDSLKSHLKESMPIPEKYVDEPHPSFVVQGENGPYFSLKKMIETQRAEAHSLGFEVPQLDRLFEGGYCEAEGKGKSKE